MKSSRSTLSVPGHVKKMHLKALDSKADVVMLDLEDSVPMDKKKAALKQVVQSLVDLDWQSKTVTVRINAPDTPFAYQEVIALVETAGEKIDALVVPKINHPGDVHFISRLIDGIEKNKNIKKQILIEASIETARGLEQVSAIAKADNRLKSLVFGVADYSLSVGAKLGSLSGHGDDETVYPGHRWHYPMSRIVAAARANELLAIDAPYGDFKDPKGLEQSAGIAAALGYDGKWVIHPDQIDGVNKIFTPSKEDINRAKRILAAINDAGSTGLGAIGVDGQMIDQATMRMAKRLWDQAVHLGLV